MSDFEATARLRRLLRQKYVGNKGANGGAWAFMEEVPSRVSVKAGQKQRFADAIAMSLYASRGIALHGFEIKASRSDWLKELRDPSKSEDFIRYCHHWWLVAEPEVVDLEAGELPDTWGLLVRRGQKLYVKQKAPLLEAEVCSLEFLSGLLRAATAESEVTPEAISEAVSAARSAERKQMQGQVDRERQRGDQYSQRIQDFQGAAGIPLNGGYPVEYGPAEVGAAVRLVLEGEAKVEGLENRLRKLAESADKLSTDARAMLTTPAPKK